ncbi:MAG: agmatine deiminase family protein [Candidatus Flexifilum sp.]
MLRFDPVPYPLWRRRYPAPVRPLARLAFAASAAARHDSEPPASAAELAHLLTRWRLLPAGMSAADVRRALQTSPIKPVVVLDRPVEPVSGPLRLPAQWEPLEAVVVTFPVLYPSLWETHLQMIEAITRAVRVDVLVPAALWARAIHLLLERRGRAALDRVRLLSLPTDDIWVRDYGPIVGYDAQGRRAAVGARYDPLPAYPQRRDDAMAARYCAHAGIPFRKLDLHTEGGNLWSDGAGTLIMSEDIVARNPGLTDDRLMDALHTAFAFEKLIITPALAYEETGHVDLVCKLAAADVVLVSAPPLIANSDRLARTIDRFRRETNAAGSPYRVFELPTPPLYLNWGVFPIFRSYTNALTVVGGGVRQVLVPVFGVETDARALDVYRQALPDHTIVPIDCRYAANGGGAVHCLTREIPARKDA